jgi:beta propeller repeat protein
MVAPAAALRGWPIRNGGTMSAGMVGVEGAVMAERSSRTWSGLRSTLALLVVIAAVTAALLAPAAAAAAPTPFPICIQMGGQAGPEIAGSMVVWTDNRNGNLDIYGRNLSTRRDYAVCTNGARQDNPSVTRYATASGKVQYVAVWVDKRNHPNGESSDIYGRDITTGERFKVAGGATIKWFPEIVDRWVIWIEADDAAGPYRVKVRDLDAAKTYLIATSSVLSPVALSRRTVGTRTVYTAVYTTGKGNISGRNVPSGTPFSVSQRDTFEWMPDISGNRVVWWESGGRVMLFNLKTHRRTFVHLGSRPRVDGELVVWDGGGHGGSFVIDYVPGAKIYARNVARSSGVVTVTQKDLTCLFPAVSGQRVVWESGPARRVLSHIHIYGARLP